MVFVKPGKSDLVTGFLGGSKKTVDGEPAIGMEKTMEKVVKTSGAKRVFVFNGEIVVGLAFKLTSEYFFVDHALEDGHNGGVGVAVRKRSKDLFGFERVGRLPKGVHDFLFESTKKMTFTITVTAAFHLRRL